MSIYVIKNYYGNKIANPVVNEAQYRELRSSEKNVHNRALAAKGNEAAKLNLVQFAYNGIPSDGKLAGTKQLGNSVLLDVDNPTKADEFTRLCLEHKDEPEFGLLMLERSARGGAHAVVRRRNGETILEAQYRFAAKIARLMDGFEFDTNNKDASRVCFSTTASPEDLLFVHPDLFNNTPCSAEEMEAVYNRINSRTENVPAELYKKNKHCIINADGQVVTENGCSTSNFTAKKGANLNYVAENGSTTVETASASCSMDENQLAIYKQMTNELAHLTITSYPNVMEGARNTTLLELCRDARHYLGMNFNMMKSVIYPDFSFGLPEKEVDSVINSSLKCERYCPKKIVKNIIVKYNNKNGVNNYDLVQSNEPADGGYPTMGEAIYNDSITPEIPKFMKIVLKVAPKGYKHIMLLAAIPPLGTLATDTRLKFGTKDPTMPNAWTHLDGQSSSNKSLADKIQKVLLRPLEKEGDVNTMLHNEAVKKNSLKKQNERREFIPLAASRILPEKTTINQHMKVAKFYENKLLFSMINEISSLTNQTGAYNRRILEYYRHSNDKYSSGNTAVNETEVAEAPVCWNIVSCGNRLDTKRHWEEEVNKGGTNRVFFVLMPDNRRAMLPEFLQYSEEDKAYIERASTILMSLNGTLRTPKIDKKLKNYINELKQNPATSNAALEFSHRVVDNSHHYAAILFLAFITQKIMDKEDKYLKDIDKLTKKIAVEQNANPASAEITECMNQVDQLRAELELYRQQCRDISQYKEPQSVVNWASFMVEYCLENQLILWEKIYERNNRMAYVDTTTRKSKMLTRYSSLPDGEFSYDDLKSIPTFAEMNDANLRQFINRCQDKYIVKLPLRDGKAYFRKM